jgi:hypothetical protein
MTPALYKRDSLWWLKRPGNSVMFDREFEDGWGPS